MKSLIDLAKEVHELLIESKMRLKLAESFSGGLISSLLVQNAGASQYLLEGIVCYSEASKCQRLGLEQEFIDEFGVVSSQVCQKMLDGLKECDIAIATTGYADTHPNIGYVGVKKNQVIVVKKIALNKARLQNIETGARLALELTKEIIYNGKERKI